jgi:hypothetical protein
MKRHALAQLKNLRALLASVVGVTVLVVGVASASVGVTVAEAASTTSCDQTCVAATINNASWILQNQDPASGWIGMSPPTSTVGLLTQSYDASYAAMGLSTAASTLLHVDQSTRSTTYSHLISTYLRADYSWLSWYAGQMAANAPDSQSAFSACSSTDVVLSENATTFEVPQR